MKKIFHLLLIICAVSNAQTTVVNTSFFSPSLNSQRDVQVILPPDYDPNRAEKYPVIYFLHGILSTNLSYTEVVTVLNSLYSSGSIEKYIVVKPDASTGPYLGSFYTNSDLYGKFEDYIVYDLINFIQNNYNADTTRNKRFITGHSMGAFGAFKLALKHPDIFRAATAHSGPLDFNNLNAQQPYVLYENGGYAPYTYLPENGIFTNIFFTMSGAFSPDLTSPPYNVDLPLDASGNFIESIRSRWMEHNPSGIVKNVDRTIFPALYFDCGNLDELKLYIHNTGFRDTLNVMGVRYKFLSYTGFHSNKLSERLVYSFVFIDSVLKSSISGVNESGGNITGFALNQNYPNPFNPSTAISISIPSEEHILLKVYDVLGNEITTLADEMKPAGTYAFSFNAEKLSSGIYFCRLEAGSYISTIKMLLLR